MGSLTSPPPHAAIHLPFKTLSLRFPSFLSFLSRLHCLSQILASPAPPPPCPCCPCLHWRASPAVPPLRRDAPASPYCLLLRENCLRFCQCLPLPRRAARIRSLPRGAFEHRISRRFWYYLVLADFLNYLLLSFPVSVFMRSFLLGCSAFPYFPVLSSSSTCPPYPRPRRGSFAPHFLPDAFPTRLSLPQSCFCP